MKVVILCGGKGTRLHEETTKIPKPMLPIGGKPILWHIMNHYASFGFNDFILCLGYKQEVIRNYFVAYRFNNCDLGVNLKLNIYYDPEVKYEIDPYRVRHPNIPKWDVILADTGQESQTGSRVKKIEKYIKEDSFFLTYGDAVTNLDISETLTFHQSHKNIGTITAVSPQSRYGELTITGDEVTRFAEKPKLVEPSISGGYFIFKKEFFEYLTDKDDCILEKEPLEQLTEDKQLKVFKHYGFWQCMDTMRDYRYLQDLWDSGEKPWTRVEIKN